MNIFINGVSKDGIIISFDHTRNIIDRQPIDIRMKESKEFPLLIDTFIKEKVGGYETLKNIILVHGPGSFTGIRALVLTINTLKFIYPHLQLTALSYFQLFTGYPIVKTSSKKDVFIQFSQNENIQVLSNEDFFSMC